MDISKVEFIIVPYKSVGPLNFGMKRKDVENLFGRKADKELKDMLGRTELNYGNISVKLDNKGLVSEVSFIDNPNLEIKYNELNIFKTENLLKSLERIEKPLNTVGYKVFFEIGIALTGYSKKKDDKTISVFAKDLIPLWKL